MTDFRIAITDVTHYGTDLFCIAGWDLLSKRMIRPEPPGTRQNAVRSRFWTSEHVGAKNVFAVGNVVTCTGDFAPPHFLLPHATEDVILGGDTMIKVVERMPLPDLALAVSPSVSKTMAKVFDGGLVRHNNGKAHVPVGHKGRSLGALNLPRNKISFHEDTYDNKTKLRARVSLPEGQFNLTVPAVRHVDVSRAANSECAERTDRDGPLESGTCSRFRRPARRVLCADKWAVLCLGRRRAAVSHDEGAVFGHRDL